MKSTELISQFEACALPKSFWTHQAHLTIALHYIIDSPDIWSAICRIKDGIIAHNRSVGTLNTGQKGYHETITVFWVFQLHQFWRENKELPFDILLDKVLSDRRFTDTSYIKQFYDVETLKSSRARAIYVAPK